MPALWTSVVSTSVQIACGGMVGLWEARVIHWLFFPKCDPATALALAVVNAFEAVAAEIDSTTHDLSSNRVLALIAPHLTAAGFTAEIGKKAKEKIRVPV